MPTRKNIPYHSGVYFITFTNYKWLPLFEITNAYDLVYKWFNYLIEKGNYIIGYVIMPNHLHLIIAFRKSKQTINTIIGNGKRFLAYGIVERLKQDNRITILETLEKGVKSTDKDRGKLHEVFEESFDWKECTSDKFIQQKLDYIHNNPCTEKLKLCLNPSDYKHSSAKFYIDNIDDEYVTNYMQLHDINLEQTYAESLAGDSAVKCDSVQAVNNAKDFPAESLVEDSASSKAQNEFYAESLAGDSAVKCDSVQIVKTANNSATDFLAESLVEDSVSSNAQIEFYAESLTGDTAGKCVSVHTVNTANNNASDFPAESLEEDSASNNAQTKK
jgi:REP element-mobilizing transposase RayT